MSDTYTFILKAVTWLVRKLEAQSHIVDSVLETLECQRWSTTLNSQRDASRGGFRGDGFGLEGDCPATLVQTMPKGHGGHLPQFRGPTASISIRSREDTNSLLTVVARMNRARFLSATLTFSSSNGYKSWQSMRTSLNRNLETALLSASMC